MIPSGYCTLPEAASRACDVLAALGRELNWGQGQNALEFLLVNRGLPVHVTRETENDLTAHIGEVYRVPQEDMWTLIESAQVLGELFESGRLPYKAPSPGDPDYEDWVKEFEEDDYASMSPYEREKVIYCFRRYSAARFLVSVDELENYLATRSYWVPDEFSKTGAPGRPSSMHIVLAEFARRLANFS